MEKEGLLLDNVESSWRGILDMTVNDVDKSLYGLTSTPVYFGLWAAPLEEMHFEDNTGKIHYEIKKGLAAKKSISGQNNLNNNNIINAPNVASQNKNLIQIAEAQKILQQKNIDIDLNNILGTYLENKNVGFNPQIPENQTEFNTPKKEPIITQKTESPKKMEEKYIENINNVIKNNIMNPARPFAKKKNETDQIKAPFDLPIRNEDPIKPSNLEGKNDFLFENPANNNNNNEESQDYSPQKMFNKPINNLNFEKNDDFSEKKFENNVNFIENKRENIPNTTTSGEEIKEKEFENSIINAQNTTLSNDLHFASFIIDKDNNEKYQQFDLINELSKEHSKFVSVLNTRTNYIKPIVHYLTAGNIKSALFLLSKFTKYAFILFFFIFFILGSLIII